MVGKAAIRSGLGFSMPNDRPKHHDKPETAAGEVWLHFEQQQMLYPP
tara:strand:- start:117 stop:257 length:141 start_codon:yes stop_codon:yes gene_type:complete